MKTALKIFRQYAKGSASRFLLQASTYMVCMIFGALVSPLLMRALFDAIDAGSSSMLLTASIWSALALAAYLFSCYINNVYGDMNFYIAANSSMASMLKQYAALPYEELHAKYEKGDLYNTFQTASFALVRFFNAIISNIAQTISLAALLVMAARTSWGMMVIAVLLVAAGTLFAWYQRRKNAAYTQREQQAKGRRESSAQLLVERMDTLRMSRAYSYVRAEDVQRREEYWRVQRDMLRTTLLVSSLQRTLNGLSQGALSLFLLPLRLGKEISVGQVSASFTLLEKLTYSLTTIKDGVANLPQHTVPLNQLDTIMRTSRAHKVDMASIESDNAIEVEGLTLERGGRALLSNIHLAIPAGQRVALVGKNGCGKSMLLRTILGLYPPDKGGARVFGALSETLTQQQRRMFIAYGASLEQLFSESVEENVLMGAEDGEEPLAQSRIQALSLGGVEQQDAKTLSGGQGKRVTLARAFAHNAPLLILDEPEAGLDPQTATALPALIRAYDTAVVVSHNAASLGLYDRIVVMEGGKVAANGTLEEIRHHPAFVDWAGSVV